jgi:putative DNA methylase
MTKQSKGRTLIESDRFPFEFISQLAERESWRKEVHRPIYHLHKWWAKRLGSVFRGILLGGTLSPESDLPTAFYGQPATDDVVVLDPFLGSGTTAGEAHKLGLTVLGRDINPVAVDAVRVALGPAEPQRVVDAYEELARGVGKRIRSLYAASDAGSLPCEVLYYFWVMQVCCPACRHALDLFPSWVIARNAYPDRKPIVQVLCPACGDIFPAEHRQTTVSCRRCAHRFPPDNATAGRNQAICPRCQGSFPILNAVKGRRPPFRLYGKLVLAGDGSKQYLSATEEDQRRYEECAQLLRSEVDSGNVLLPSLKLQDGYNARQAMSYGFTAWRDFFNDRQLLSLGWLQAAIMKVADDGARNLLLTLFSGILEFNNMFASYKGEGTGAVRHMFSHHILKPERTPIEANVWGTPKSSGSFSNLFRSRLLRALEYRARPTELGDGRPRSKGLCSLPFSCCVEDRWPTDGVFAGRSIYLSCGDSAVTGLPDGCIGLVVTDPPFFDNVHYSELADFFYSWQQLSRGRDGETTRSPAEVQDADPRRFAEKLRAVFQECHRVLSDDGLLVFTYHHSREQGWTALAEAILGAGFRVVNSHPVKAEMSVATPKSQAREPIQLDIILVCRKAARRIEGVPTRRALASARAKTARLETAGFKLSRNDRRVVLFGQLLTTLESGTGAANFAAIVDSQLSDVGVRQRTFGW